MATAAAAEPAPAPAAAAVAAATDSDYTGPEKVTVKTSDDKEFVINMTYMYTCKMLTVMFAPLDDDSAVLPLDVSSQCLEKVDKFCKFHHENPTQRSVLDERFVINHFMTFDKQFSEEMSKDLNLLFQTIRAADYLNERYLLDVLCRTAALLIKNKCQDKVREILSIGKASDAQHKANAEKHAFIKKYN